MIAAFFLCAEWIAGTYVPPAETETRKFFEQARNDVVARTFAVRDIPVRRAIWRVAAPGMRDLFVNDERVTATALPPLTPYRKRVLEESFDVTSRIRRGAANTLRVELGNGWYNPLPLKFWYAYNLREALAVGTPCVRATLELDYADGRQETVETDGSWCAAKGRVIHNSIYLGVVEDARLTVEFSGTAQVVKGPAGIVQPAGALPKVIIYDRWKAKRVTQVSNGVWIVDMGVNAAGTFRAKLRGVPAGRKVHFRQGERILEDGTVNVMTAVAGQIKDPLREPLFAVAEQRDTIVGNGSGEIVFEPRLTFHVFRYIQIEGLDAAPQPDDFEMCAWSADVKERSFFTCSNERLNCLHEICRRTFRSNLQSVQSDCPGREKFGYGGDIACTADAFWCNYDMQAFYRKTVRDFMDEAADDGILTETAPYVGIASRGVFPQKDQTARGSAPMGWAVGLPVLLDSLVRYAGDLGILAEAYPALVRYIALVRARYPDHDIPECLGDWIPPDESLKADTRLSAIAHWHQFLALTAKFAGLLGRSNEAVHYGALAENVARKFRSEFVNSDGIVGRGVQGDQIFALYHGLLDGSDVSLAEARLKDDVIRRGDSLMTGIFGTKYLLEYLSTHGEAELAGRIVTHEGDPGWFHMIDRGATTLWEGWHTADCSGIYSNCHPMFGSVDEWMVRHVLGIAVCDDAVGCDRVMIDPKPVAGVTSASGWLDTPKGRISVSWKLVEGKLIVEKTVPKDIAEVPSADKRVAAEETPGTRSIRHEWCGWRGWESGEL